MMITVNVVVLAGQLTDTPEIMDRGQGAEARFRLHVPEPGKRVLPLPVRVVDPLQIGLVAAGKESGELVKGAVVLVRGHLERRFFRDGGGGRSVTEVVATEVKKLEAEDGE